MYINLDKIKLKRESTPYDDFTILSEVVDSGLSYESPVLVRTIDELNIWFGKNFSSYDYCKELISEGATLYLYKPISPVGTHSKYVDLAQYVTSPTIYANEKQLPETGIVWEKVSEAAVIEQVVSELPTKPVDNGVYKVGDDLFKYIPTKYQVGNDWWIWYFDDELDGEWLSESFLPQNMTNDSKSLTNRDVIEITRPDYSGVSFFYPEFDLEYGPGVYSKTTYPIKYNNESYNLDKILKNYSSTVFKITSTSDTLSRGYIVVQGINTKPILAWVGTDTDVYKDIEIINSGNKYFDSDDIRHISTLQDLFDIYVELNYSCEFNNSKCFSAYSSKEIRFTNLCTIPELTITSDFRAIQNIIALGVPDQFKSIKIWSKTIGRSFENYDQDYIKIKIEKVPNVKYIYRFTITRFDYDEIFEGTIKPGVNEERLDYVITRESKLINVHFSNLVFQGFTLDEYPTYDNNHYVKLVDSESNYSWDDSMKINAFGSVYVPAGNSTSGNTYTLSNCIGIRTGEYVLRGGEIEEVNTDFYWKSLNTLFSLSNDNIYPDFFLVPDKSKYIKSLGKSNFYDEYLDFLYISNYFNCQFLIQNDGTDYTISEVSALPSVDLADKNTIYYYNKIYYWLKNNTFVPADREFIEIANYGTDAVWNYTLDKDNRLVYFYKPMTYNYKERPAYYIFLEGIFRNIFSLTSRDINYEAPISYKDVYYENFLSAKKSNFLMYNNQMYYYKSYQNGKNFNTSIWMRFILGKIFRQLEKNRWDYLAQRSISTVRSRIQNTLNQIVSSYSIVDSINIDNVSEDLTNYSIELSLSTRLKDLVNNNISLDITINYNSNN